MIAVNFRDGIGKELIPEGVRAIETEGWGKEVLRGGAWLAMRACVPYALFISDRRWKVVVETRSEGR